MGTNNGKYKRAIEQELPEGVWYVHISISDAFVPTLCDHGLALL